MRNVTTEYPFHLEVDRAAKYASLSFEERLALLVNETELVVHPVINDKGEVEYKPEYGRE